MSDCRVTCRKDIASVMAPLVAYLSSLSDTHASGASTPETSYYPALSHLLNAVGETLKPKVRCITNLKNQGAGLPDGGLFTVDQLGRKGQEVNAAVAAGIPPSRGAIEVKPPSQNLNALAESKQAKDYGRRYRHVLLTNLREFALVEYEAVEDPIPRILGRYELAKDEATFWRLCATPAKGQTDHGTKLALFLERALRTPAPLTTPEDLAWFLASYARDALDAIEHAPVKGLTDLAAHLEGLLGVGYGFGTEGGDPEATAKARHFFNSTLVQTLFYGVFSAWVLWHRSNPKPGERFSWKDTSELLHLTLLKVLFHEMTRPGDFFREFVRDSLGLAEDTLNRVDRASFFQRFREHEAVQYFYEPFLEAFDPQLRKDLGVWYTPDEVVRYMVERCDRALRDDLGITAGFADPSVQVLDPCCGTGAFLVAVLERIYKTLCEQGDEALAPAQVAKAVRERVLGFEIMPAPFVVAHLQVALYLQQIGTRLGEGRAAIYLTNALTGWEKPTGVQQRLLPELKEERDAADAVKRKAKVIVVLGNPPYNAFAGVQPLEEQESVEVYKAGLFSQWGIRKFNLDDLYVRFMRLAERKIAEQSKRGVVCLISNASYVSDPSFVVLRDRFLRQFDRITIDNLNGDSRETGKLTPQGLPDPSVFSTDRNREGIRVGTSIGLFVLTGDKRTKDALAAVRWRDFWGARKRASLIESLAESTSGYAPVLVTADGRWSFKPQAGSAMYGTWPKLVDLCEHDPISGLAEMRRGGLLAMERPVLVERLRAYFDSSVAWNEAIPVLGGLAVDAGRFPAKATRARFLAEHQSFDDASLRRYALLPLDHRWCYHTNARPLWNEPRPALAEQAWDGNRMLVTRMNAERPGEQSVVLITTAFPDYHLLRPNVVAIPLRWRTTELGVVTTRANLSSLARGYLASVGIADADADETRATALWFHALAITYSPTWLAENGPAIRADFPRVPLPIDRAVLDRSAALGCQIADLLDPDVPVVGVTSGKLRDDLRCLGQLRHSDKATIDEADLTVAARWGMLQRETVVMPGPGRITDADDPVLATHPLGPVACDVWLNGQVYLRSVPAPVWDFTIGGYQVIKKWLSYREKVVLGRGLTLHEAQHLTGMVRRIAAILLLAPELDAIYAGAKASTWMPNVQQVEDVGLTIAAPAAAPRPAAPSVAEPSPPAPANLDKPYFKLLAALRKRGSLASSDAQAVVDLGPAEVRPLLQRLVAEGHARVEGQKRGTRYVAK